MTKQNKEIKVGFCVAYDWYLLRYAIPLIYKQADKICLSLDNERRSWAGNLFSWDETGFRNMVAELDPENKIDVYEDNFHLSELAPMQNEVRQRKMIAARMGSGGWHIQLDADEYFLHFDRFVTFLKKQATTRPVNIWCPYITLFKQTNSGFLAIGHEDFFSADGNPVATNQPDYRHGRISNWFNIRAPYYIIHQSWARDISEITEKITNWGHKNDFDSAAFLSFWNTLSETNYTETKNFHPIQPSLWQSLYLLPGKTIDELIVSSRNSEPAMPAAYKLAMKNSIWLSRLKKLVRR